MSKNPHQLTGAQLVERVLALSRRLTRHLDAWDAGDEDAMEDVAGVTRVLLAMGKGDKALLRLCAQERVPEPLVRVARYEIGRPATIFSFGNVPVDDLPGEADGTGLPSEEIPLRQWLHLPAVESISASRRVTSWEQLITDIGNTYGAHLSSTVPRALKEISLYAGPVGTMQGLALRSAAVAAERALASILPQVSDDAVVRIDREFQPTNAVVAGMLIHTVNRLETVTVQFYGRDRGDGRILELALGGKMISFSWVMQDDGFGHLEMTVREP